MLQALLAYLRQREFRAYALVALLASFVWLSRTVWFILTTQPAGADYSCFWAGVQTALADPTRIYDFRHVTDLQGWPFGTMLRPYIYPPSALPFFVPFGVLPYWVGYGAWVAATYALFAWAGRRIGAPWWMVLFPVVLLVALIGQITFLTGGLVAAALTFQRRPIVAGVLLGIAAAIKPQILLFVPLALLAEGRWRTIVSAGITALVPALVATAIWGPHLWLDWLAALPRFHDQVIFNDPLLIEDAITPYAMLIRLGLPGAWAFVLAPLAVALVWTTFRRPTELPDRLIVVFAAALMVSPYAMHYEACLLAPGVAAYLARTKDRFWPLYATVACFYTLGLVYGFAPVAVALVLPLSTWMRTLDPPPWLYVLRSTAKSARS